MNHPEIIKLQKFLQLKFNNKNIDVRPDWPVFEFADCDVFLEADMGTETLDTSHPKSHHTSSITGKIDQYLSILDQYPDALFLFVTVRNTRRDSMRELLKTRASRKQAAHFAFSAIPYDRYLNTIPKPSSSSAMRARPSTRNGNEPTRTSNSCSFAACSVRPTLPISGSQYVQPGTWL